MMAPLQVDLLPAFSDNYIFSIVNTITKECIFVDPGTLDGIPDYVRKNGLTPIGVLLTHHHNDHIGGVQDLLKHWRVPVYAPRTNKAQIPFATNWIVDQDIVVLADFTFVVMELPGHTLGHVGYFNADHNWLFSGDVLFGLGCGRLFEGTFEQGFESLQRIKALPASTSVYCAHEYTQSNLRFCKTLDSQPGELREYEEDLLKKRSQDLPSVPLHLKKEMGCNPFLLARNVSEFREVREKRNKF